MIRCNNLSSYIYEWVSTPDPIILWEKLRGLRQLSVSGLRRTNEELSDGVNNLMKRLLNDPVMNDTGWLDHNKKVKRETDLQSDNKGTRSKWYLSCHWHCTPEGFTSMAPLWLLYLWWPYPQWLYLRGLGRVFSSQSLLGLSRLSNKCVTDQFRTALTKRLKELSLSLVALIINPAKQEWLWCMRLPSLRCTRPHSLQCALSLQDSLNWWYTPTLQGCYISPGEYQAYKTYYLYFQSIPRSLQGLLKPPRSCGSPDRLVAIVIELLEFSLQG